MSSACHCNELVLKSQPELTRAQVLLITPALTVQAKHMQISFLVTIQLVACDASTTECLTPTTINCGECAFSLIASACFSLVATVLVPHCSTASHRCVLLQPLVTDAAAVLARWQAYTAWRRTKAAVVTISRAKARLRTLHSILHAWRAGLYRSKFHPINATCTTTTSAGAAGAAADDGTSSDDAAAASAAVAASTIMTMIECVYPAFSA